MACETCLRLRERAYSFLAGGTRHVAVTRNYTHPISSRLHIQYLAGTTYSLVPDAVANAIVAANAGTTID